MIVVYDAGALIAAEKSSVRIHRLARKIAEAGRRPAVPTVVAAQVLRNPARQVRLLRFLRAAELEAFTSETASRVGRILAASGTSDVVDAAVVDLAHRAGALIVTSDPGDIGMLITAMGWRIPVSTL
ncbi:MAG: PIN domain-containing protein [Mycobacteriales bacterium]